MVVAGMLVRFVRMSNDSAMCPRLRFGQQCVRVSLFSPCTVTGSQPRGAVDSGLAAALAAVESVAVFVRVGVVGFGWMVVRFVRVIRVPACARVSRVSRVCPGSPRCLFTGNVNRASPGSPRCLCTGTVQRFGSQLPGPPATTRASVRTPVRSVRDADHSALHVTRPTHGPKHFAFRGKTRKKLLNNHC